MKLDLSSSNLCFTSSPWNGRKLSRKSKTVTSLKSVPDKT